jgi:salicylate hydroxylase
MQYGWVDDGACFLHDVLENRKDGAMYHVRGGNRITAESKSWADETFVGGKATALVGWPDGWKEYRHTVPNLTRLTKLIKLQLLLDQPNLEGYSAWEHKTTSTYTNRRICIADDAAHAMTP